MEEIGMPKGFLQTINTFVEAYCSCCIIKNGMSQISQYKISEENYSDVSQ
jgi:hypothetical protein